jgi:hypothetical protein
MNSKTNFNVFNIMGGRTQQTSNNEALNETLNHDVNTPYISQRPSIKDSRRWDSSRRLVPSSMSHGGDGIHLPSIRHQPLTYHPRLSTIRSTEENGGDNVDDKNKGGDGHGGNDPFSSMAVHSVGSCIDQSDAVHSFFASIRVPASFITATSFSELFGMYNGEEDKNSTTIQKFLQGFCMTCQGFSFILSLSVILISTSALTRGLTANFDPYAENGYELLFREFHYEFVVTRWSFTMSMFGFLLAVGAKILYEFELINISSDNFDRSRLEIGIAVVLIMSSLCLHLYSYLNSTLIGWKNSKLHNPLCVLVLSFVRTLSFSDYVCVENLDSWILSSTG